MAKIIVMPKMGEAMEEGQITEWLVKEGDKVAKNQSLFELMTDKTTMEFPCPEDATVLKIMGEVEEDYPCGTPSSVSPARISPAWFDPGSTIWRFLRPFPIRGFGK